MITIEKAIESINEVKKLDCHIKYPEWQEALQLGIEALKRERERRSYTQQFNYLLLPGETKE